MENIRFLMAVADLETNTYIQKIIFHKGRLNLCWKHLQEICPKQF